MDLDSIWRCGEGDEIVEWIWTIWQGTEETAEKVVSLLLRNTNNFGLFYLKDLTEVWEPHKNLFSKSLWTYNWVDMAFQSTKWLDWWVIAEHSHNNPEKNDITDELIIMMNEWWVYWDIGAFLANNWIIRIPAWATHWWKSSWNWISLKPREYKFIEWDDKRLIYWNWQKKIKIMRLLWDKVFSTRELWYKEDVLFLEFWGWSVNIRKNINDKILSSWDFIVIWEV